jgi:hypothetical protein
VKEYEVYLPLRYNDGSLIENHKIDRVGELLLEQFGGVTYFPQPNRGLWQMGGVTFRDDIVLFRVLTGKTRTAKRFFKALKEELKHDFGQEEILIVAKDAEIL